MAQALQQACTDVIRAKATTRTGLHSDDPQQLKLRKDRAAYLLLVSLWLCKAAATDSTPS